MLPFIVTYYYLLMNDFRRKEGRKKKKKNVIVIEIWEIKYGLEKKKEVDDDRWVSQIK